MSTDGGYVARFARLALGGVRREYPNHIAHVMRDASQVGTPRELHPAFYGCYDWHSSVHGHWLLARLLRAGGGVALPEDEMREALGENLTAENLRAEDEYFQEPGRAPYERPYGWAWLLKLHEELYHWADPDAARWFDALRPLAKTIVGKYLDFFPKQKYPVRVGTHFNTAFGLSFAWDYAETLARGGKKNLDAATLERLARLKSLVEARALFYFGEDREAPAAWEPGGDDFLSSSLVEADLMRRVLGREEFARWFEDFLPGVEEGRPANLFEPADVTDRSDPKIVHLDGLNLSRAWCMWSVASALPEGSPRAAVLARAAERHADATLPHVTSGDYAGEHWLATFAVYMLSNAPRRPPAVE
ncbi:MAG TPA: DUF2891 domain-containing protein [Pyrinomonadaceae bacterium]|jgi:hypothetical protein